MARTRMLREVTITAVDHEPSSFDTAYALQLAEVRSAPSAQTIALSHDEASTMFPIGTVFEMVDGVLTITTPDGKRSVARWGDKSSRAEDPGGSGRL